MLMKVAVLVFIILTVKGFLNLFKGNKSWDDSITQWKDIVDKNGFTVTFVAMSIITILFTTYFILLYYNIGKVNELMMWLSATQIVFALISTFKTINIITMIGDGKLPKRTNLLVRFMTVGFDTFYIALAIMYMYFV